MLASVTYINPQGLVAFTNQRVRFVRKELAHEARRVEIWEEKKKKSVVLLTNNFELTVEELAEIYRLRWVIESLYYVKSVS